MKGEDIILLSFLASLGFFALSLFVRNGIAIISSITIMISLTLILVWICEGETNTYGY